MDLSAMPEPPLAPTRRRWFLAFILAALGAVLLAALASPLEAQRRKKEPDIIKPPEEDIVRPVIARPADNKPPPEYQGKAPYAVLMDADTGAVLYQLQADEAIPPASMSKLMTLAVIFRALKLGQVKLENEFAMSVNAWRRGGAPSGTSAMMVPVNHRVKLDELIQGIAVQSGNDASIAVAEGMAGSEEVFATLLNSEARRIGLRRSTFRNATGLHNPEHLMSLRDIAEASRFLIREYPEYYHYFGQREFRYRHHKFSNRNPLLFLNMGVDGLKTGQLGQIGLGLAASAKVNDRRLIVVVHGLKNPIERREEAKKLLEWGFRSFSTHRIFDAGEQITSARVFGAKKVFVPLVGKGDVHIVLPRAALKHQLRAQVVYQGPLKPPLKEGDQVGILRVTTHWQGAREPTSVNEIPLYAAEDVPSAGAVWRGIDAIMHLGGRWVKLL